MSETSTDEVATEVGDTQTSRPVAFHFVHHNFPPATYESALEQLENVGAGHPAGRLQHFALLSDSGDIVVFDIWDSQEAFDAFGAILVPILEGLGVSLDAPMVTPLFNRIDPAEPALT